MKKKLFFNLGDVLNKKGLANLMLRAGDAVRVFSVEEIQGPTQYVEIDGFVKRPGNIVVSKEHAYLRLIVQSWRF